MQQNLHSTHTDMGEFQMATSSVSGRKPYQHTPDQLKPGETDVL